jgi:hsp70-interacting protein
MASAGGGGNPSWAWLGLLKWSLSHVDGTRPSDETMAPMSEEKRKFLEMVMTEGIVDPSKRMQELLAKLTDALYVFKQVALQETSDHSVPDAALSVEESKADVLDQDGMVDALEEIRDIVEQIDYAQYFVKMNGLPFLLGCIAERRGVPAAVRLQCLKVLSTSAQNNPPVQQAMLDTGALDVLVGFYVAEADAPENDPNGNMRAMILQTLSCTVRGHVVGEESFCQSQVCRAVVANALGLGPQGTVTMPPLKLARKAVFVLRALVTSDISSRKRVKDFNNAILRTIDFVDFQNMEDLELREASLSLLLQILQQGNSVDGIVSQTRQLVGLAVVRVAQIRQMDASSEEGELYSQEKDLWESVLMELAKKPCDAAIDAQLAQEAHTSSAPLMLGGRPPDDPCTDLAQ